MAFSRSDLPSDFLFGAATAAYQIEGQSFGGAGPCHWDSFAATAGNVAKGDNGARACEHYLRYEEDLDLVRDAHMEAYRFSTNWSRIFPDGPGAANGEGLAFYDRLIDAMLARDLKPFCTLYHWELPQWMSDIGGWRNPDVANHFADFAEIIGQRFGDRLSHIATINEPWCVSFLSHFLGHHAPGLRDIRATARSMHFVLLAHGRAMQRLRTMGLKNLGIVLNQEWFEPMDNKPESARAVAMSNGIFNDWFLSGVFNGRYPEIVLDGLAAHMPAGWQDDMPVIATEIDWLGVNYYSRGIISADRAPGAMWPGIVHNRGSLSRTQMDWEIYPEGLYRTLKRIAGTYRSDIPIFVTENGMASADELVNGAVNDDVRVDYLGEHIHAVARAADEGVPMKGYFAWSLLDNFEWSFGYDKRFGLVHVDYDTMKRTPKASYHMLKRVLA